MPNRKRADRLAASARISRPIFLDGRRRLATLLNIHSAARCQTLTGARMTHFQHLFEGTAMRRLLVACLLPALVLSFAGCQDKPKTAGGAGLSTAGRKTMSRADFEKAVMGKTPKEVIEAVGEPDQKVTAPPSTNQEWSWASLTTGGAKPDVACKAYFENGKVVRVEYME